MIYEILIVELFVLQVVLLMPVILYEDSITYMSHRKFTSKS